MSYTVRIEGLERLQRALDPVRFETAIERGLDRVIVELGAHTKQEVPRKTGFLGRSIQPGSRHKGYRELLIHAGYAAFVEGGTRPHDIRPRYARVLRFAASASGRRLTGSPRRGAEVTFATLVHHPGTRANPFLRRAIVRTHASAILGEEVRRAWRAA